ncbi:uncharacterized protein [Dermacentor andersoni]|uniref:uncharacterized protein n=1 Tax=Dermacentor andersoni TaxID=34620 RepID=UPI003B3A8073
MMTGSVGAASAASSGRGNRAMEMENDYQVVLPSLPTGRLVLNTVFLHADIRARPYRVEDFRDALARQSLLSDVIALGAYRMSHVWAITLKDADAVKKIAGVGELRVKERRCLVIDPANQDVRLKLHWLLHTVPDEDVRAALAPYGKVSEVARERWRVHGVSEKGSTSRMVTLKLKAGVKLDDLPHQLNVGGELALVVVPGRPPLCLRCRGTGHIRRECKVPRCGACRRFGHEDGECPRTYASIAGPGTSEDASEHLMDEADAEEAARTTGKTETKDGPSFTPLVKQKTTTTLTSPAVVASQLAQRDPESDSGHSAVADTKASLKTPDRVEPRIADAMDADDEAAALTAGKRSREESAGENLQPGGSSSGEPPPKTTGSRRSSLKPRPNLLAESRQAGKLPP